MGKRLSTLLLVITMCITAQAWDGDFTIDDIVYRISSTANRTVYVCGTEYNDDGMYRIPETVEYAGVTFTVIGIGVCALTDSYVSGVSIPASIKTLDEGAFFFNNETLETLIIEDSPDVLDCTAMRGVNNIESGQFCCTIIKNLYLGRDLTYIPWSKYYRDYRPFIGVNTIETITVGQYVTDMSPLDYSVEYCSNLKSITFNGDTPPTACNFSELQKLTVHLYVPKGALSAYKSSRQWSDFVNITEIDSDIATVSIDYDQKQGSVFAGRVFVEDEIRLDKGSDLTLTIIPESGYEVRSIMVDGVEQIQNLGSTYSITLQFVSADTHIVILFSAPQCEVCLKTQGGGSFVLPVDHGSDLTLDLRADDGWTLQAVTVNGTDCTDKVVNGKLALTNIVSNTVVTPRYALINPDDAPKPADVNGDGHVDTSDVLMIYDYIRQQ